MVIAKLVVTQYRIFLVQAANSTNDSLNSGEQGVLKSMVDPVVFSIVKFHSLEQDLHNLKQEHYKLNITSYSKLYNLEIAVMMEKEGENVRSYEIAIARCASVELTNDDIIITVLRVQPKVDVLGRSKNIVVRLKPPILKDSIMS